MRTCNCDVPSHIHFPQPVHDPEDHAFVPPRWWKRLAGYSMCRVCDCPIGWHDE